MNENTLVEKIAEIDAKIANSGNALEQSTLAEERRLLKVELAAVRDKTKRKEVKLKTNIDAPIIGDSKDKNGVTNRQTFIPNSDGTFITMI